MIVTGPETEERSRLSQLDVAWTWKRVAAALVI